jgi:hypothetical protein
VYAFFIVPEYNNKPPNIMKKILLLTVFSVVGLMLSAQNLYVKLFDRDEQIVFPLVQKPKLTFEDGAQMIELLSKIETFQLDEIQNLTFVFVPSTRISENFENHKIHFYPNPVKDKLTLVVENYMQGMTYRIIDMSAGLQKTSQIQSETTEIDMQNFRSGTYILHIEHNGQLIQTFKIVKQ